MDQNQNSEAAYMSMLTRNIPGVGTAPFSSTTTTPATPTTTLLTNFSGPSSALTDTQSHAINILEGAIKDALFVSEGEEPFQVVHIIPNQSAPIVDSNMSTPPPPPSSEELLKILNDSLHIPLEDNGILTQCEQLSDLKAITDDSNPGGKRIAVALKEIFGSQPVTLYRVILPSSSTSIHLWILGWSGRHLLGLHTISIET
ncbi:hypothetical protein BGZ76_005473 [Entomortierella beljakovae]|nr:hypothetical protein BGZ76_005473 [Entomortierella beljakovae]